MASSRSTLAGSRSATVISSGGTDLVFGSDTHDQVLAGGVETIGAGGVVSAVTGSGLFTADSDAECARRRALFNAIVYSGGLLNISSGGTAAMFAVSSGGSANVIGTSLSNSVIESGGVEVVSSGGIVSGAFGGSGNSISGTLDVLSGGALAIGAVFGGGVLNVSAWQEQPLTLLFRVVVRRSSSAPV